MKNDALPTALERLIQPLPNDLKAGVLEAWKNEDIPHDENDSVFRLLQWLRAQGNLRATLLPSQKRVTEIAFSRGWCAAFRSPAQEEGGRGSKRGE